MPLKSTPMLACIVFASISINHSVSNIDQCWLRLTHPQFPMLGRVRIAVRFPMLVYLRDLNLREALSGSRNLNGVVLIQGTAAVMKDLTQ